MAAERALRVPAREKMSRGKGRRSKMERKTIEDLDVSHAIRNSTKLKAQTITETSTESLRLRLKRYHSGRATTKYLK